ncbi:hypothetical protein MMC12_004255 [Toensbergia leucococca]|nr:hypothetical protein [Toensbergia leucococca]
MVYTIIAHLYTLDDPKAISQIKAKLTEAAQIYRKDKETIQWEVMQSVSDPRAFTVVERYESESTFNPYVEPLLSQPIDLRRFEELE